MNDSERNTVAKAVKILAEVFRQMLNDTDDLGPCLLCSVAANAILSTSGVQSRVMAGTMMWPRIRPEEDDGVCPTHFSYVFEPGSIETRQRIAAHVLPELHCWLVVEGEILDFATGRLPNQCQRLLGLPWTADPPPPYIWTTPDKLPANVIYAAHPQATKIAWEYGLRLIAKLQTAQAEINRSTANN